MKPPDIESRDNKVCSKERHRNEPQVTINATRARLGPLAHGMGLIHPITSYCGRVVIAFTSDRDMLPDPAFYAQCIEDSFDEMKSAAGSRSP